MVNDDASCQIWLILLPRHPSDVSLSTLKVAYEPGLTKALQLGAKQSQGSSDVIFDIAIDCGSYSWPDYSGLQNLFGLMYRLICLICTEQRIDLQYGNDVDARVALFRHAQPGSRAFASPHAPITNLETLAQTDRRWKRVLTLDSENAENLLQDFVQLRNEHSQDNLNAVDVERLPGGLVVRHNTPEAAPQGQGKAFRGHPSVAVGGTFDHLHAGHKLLLTMAAFTLDTEATKGGCLTIGITGDELLKKKQYREQLEDFPARQSAIRRFMLSILQIIAPSHVLGITQQVTSSESFGREVQDILRSGLIIKYVEIFDPCGPTITDEAISALVISAETRSGGQVVNQKRHEKGWPALEVFEIDVLDAGNDETSHSDDNFQSKISSTDIRRRLHQKNAPADAKNIL